MSESLCKHSLTRSTCAQCFNEFSIPVDAYLAALSDPKTTHRLMDMKAEPDYVAWLADALSALQNIPEDEHSEEVGETIDAVIDDLGSVLTWLRGA